MKAKKTDADVREYFLQSKKKADNEWDSMYSRILCGEKVERKEIVDRMSACNNADSAVMMCDRKLNQNRVNVNLTRFHNRLGTPTN